METIILWISFIGAWLLFAGPIYQAALELQDEEIEIDRIRAAGAKVAKPNRVPVWWWILPPIKVLKEWKHRHDYQHRYLKALSPEDVEALVAFRSKASAWLFVAVGGLCIASKETFELTHHLGWSSFSFAILIVVMFFASLLNLIWRVRKAEKLVGTK